MVAIYTPPPILASRGISFWPKYRFFVFSGIDPIPLAPSSHLTSSPLDISKPHHASVGFPDTISVQIFISAGPGKEMTNVLSPVPIPSYRFHLSPSLAKTHAGASTISGEGRCLAGSLAAAGGASLPAAASAAPPPPTTVPGAAALPTLMTTFTAYGLNDGSLPSAATMDTSYRPSPSWLFSFRVNANFTTPFFATSFRAFGFF